MVFWIKTLYRLKHFKGAAIFINKYRDFLKPARGY